MANTTKRYTAQAHPQSGSWFETYCWRVVDSQPAAPGFSIVASGTEKHMRRWARELNARS